MFWCGRACEYNISERNPHACMISIKGRAMLRQEWLIRPIRNIISALATQTTTRQPAAHRERAREHSNSKLSGTLSTLLRTSHRYVPAGKIHFAPIAPHSRPNTSSNHPLDLYLLGDPFTPSLVFAPAAPGRSQKIHIVLFLRKSKTTALFRSVLTSDLVSHGL